MRILIRLPALLLIIVASFAINSCNKRDCNYSNGNSERQVVSVPAFTAVHVYGNGNVYLSHGPDLLVEVYGNEHAPGYFDLDVSDGTLNIRNSDSKCYDDDNTIPNIYITLPSVSKLSMSGSGIVRSENTLIADVLDIDINGSGEMQLSVFANRINSDLSGSCKLTLSGSSSVAKHSISGSPDLHAFGLQTHETEIDMNGSGLAEVWVLDNLTIDINGSCEVWYKGNPVVVSDQTGSGSIHHVQ